eukprot:CAMPEP_0185855306 /NCGR_PEP_ID=MMETSP1354-20130828/25222_1 /TAXON_ID=708628 /ORGANISM="Erythrolobus madagascarensis, Strain CCMP3276" /LENGTH=66 /DNA_ID=CAMNT_0028557297 /DNA_START=94 /DNA_END=292 /DNA_ORIENTATION=+
MNLSLGQSGRRGIAVQPAASVPHVKQFHRASVTSDSNKIGIAYQLTEAPPPDLSSYLTASENAASG